MRRLTLALLATVLAVPAAQAADLPAPLPAPAAWSMSIFGGATWLDDAGTDLDGDDLDLGFDTGFIVGGTFGYTFVDWARTELEIAYTSSDATASFGRDEFDGEFSALSVMGNMWLGFNMLPVVGGTVNDIGSGMGFSPYFGGGLGVGFLNAEAGDLDIDEDATAFAWQVGAGVRWTFAENIGLDVGYRYRNFVDVDFSDEVGAFDLSSHNLIAGVTFNF
jgi:opacity protein-like surface antigen